MLADGKVVIDTGLNNDGLIADIEGIFGAFSGLNGALDKIATSIDGIGSQIRAIPTNNISEAFEAEGNRVKAVLNETVNHAKETAKEITQSYEKQADKQTESFQESLQEIKQDAKKGAQSVNDQLETISGKSKNVGKKVESNFSTSFSAIARKIGFVITAAFSVQKIFDFGKQAIELGSDLAEVQNVVDVSFGSMSAACEDFSKSAIMNFGMSELAAKRTASTYMAMAKGLGVADEAARDMSIGLAALSGDAASFFNMDQDYVKTKLTGVFTGETEALKELGVVMTQANLKQFALEKGMNANIETMSQAELVALRYAFVTDTLSLAAGDFIRTQDSWANQTRILSMQWESFMSVIGQTLTTILLPAVKALNSMLSSLIGLAQQLNSFVNGLFGIEQVVGVTSSVGTGLDSAADSAEDLAEATKKAGKAAKALAGFDQLNKLSAPSGGSTADTSAIGGGVTSTTITGAAATDTISSSFQTIADKIRDLIDPLQEIDLLPLKESLKDLWEAFENFAAVIGNVFEWVWYEILVPLAQWGIEEGAPVTVDALAAAFEGLSATVSVLIESFKECWDEIEPVISWIAETVLVVLEDLKDIGQDIAAKWEKNAPKIKKIFENIGTVIEKIWAVIGPIVTWIRDAVSTIATEIPGNELQYIIDRLFAISEILAGLFTGDIQKIFSGFGAAIAAETDYAEAQIKTFASSLGIDLDVADQWVKETAENIGRWFSDAWDKIVGVWEGVASWFNDTVIAPLQEFWAPIGEWFGELFGGIEQTLSDVFYNIGVLAEGCWELVKYAWASASGWFDENVIQPLVGYFEDTWSNASAQATEAWGKIKEAFRPITDWIDENVAQPVESAFADLWGGFSEKATEAWESVKEAFVDMGQWAKDILNELIRALNSGLTSIFGGVNKALSKMKDLQVGDMQPFANIKTITVPQIPYLAKGAVIPPNAPFMAVLGDQRHGTNIEAPLSTIQEAVAAVMEDYSAANMAGHGATVAVLREILEAVLGIEIGDEVIANAVQRHQTKMAIVRGG